MHLLDQRTLGAVILVLIAMLVTTKRIATGSIMKERPERGFWLWVVHAFNLFFLLVANPLAAILLLTGRMDRVDSTRLAIQVPWLVTGLECAGLVLYVTGYLLMAWALIRMGGTYQVGGSHPRAADRFVTLGPYKLVRHPMYTAALCIALGLACLTQSLAYAAVFCTYVVLLVALIPAEEAGLRRAYGDQYARYQRHVRRVVPFLY